jgi:hypothetical protein
MSLNFSEIKKTAAQTAVFYLAITVVSTSVSFAVETNFDATKKKVSSFLIQKKKKEALLAIDEFILSEKNKSQIKEARELKSNIAKKFLTKEAQEFYEVSLNSTLENFKEAQKNVEDCLALEPENLDCQIQKVRLIYRSNPAKFSDAAEIEKVNKYFIDSDFNWVKISTEKNTAEFKNLNFYKKEFGPMGEDKLVRALLEVDRAFAAKNFSKAKEVLQILDTNFKDWPDLVFFMQNINVESTENKGIAATEAANLYQMKCKNLSKTISRKYRYDFDLCLRGVL